MLKEMVVFSRILLAAALVAPLLVGQEAPTTPPNKSEIEQIVRDYILQHPEILLQSVRMYQDRERAAQQQKAKDAVAAHQPELLGDPTSPATKPASAQPAGEVTMVEFFDYKCGFCKKVNPTVMKLLADNPNLRLVFKEFPILGPESVTAAKAGLAAQRQGKYLQFHRAMMASTAPLNAALVDQIAAQVGLDVVKLKADMGSPEIAAILAKNVELATALDVSSTPTFVIGNEMFAGAMEASAFQKLIAKAQAKSN
jgi:protein-disulfide isomerase